MGPRLTAQQGIELLKIHQLRRENAAIYQQLQSLRDAVCDIKDEHGTLRDQTQKSNLEIESITTSLSKKQKLDEKIAADVEMLLQSRDEMGDSFERLQTDCEQRQKRSEERHNQLMETVQYTQSELKELKKGQQEYNIGLQTAMSGIKKELIHKAEATDLDTLRDHLVDVEARLTNALDCKTAVETILVQRSTEEEIVPLETIRLDSASGFLQQTYRPSFPSSPDSLFDDPDIITETASYDESEVAIEPLIEGISRASSGSREIDLDENVEPSDISSEAQCTFPSDSLITITRTQHDKQPTSSERSPKLNQEAAQGFSTYLARVRQGLSPSSIATEEAETRHFIDGMLDMNLKVILTQWLNMNAWNMENLEQFIEKHNLRQPPHEDTLAHGQQTSGHVNQRSKTEENSMSTSTVPTPRTPCKKLPRRQDELYHTPGQLDQRTSSASPLLGKVLHTRKLATRRGKLQFFDASPLRSDKDDCVEVETRSIEYAPMSPSPYNPKPRLVSRRRKRVLISKELIGDEPQSVGVMRRTSRQKVSEEIPPWITNGDRVNADESRCRKKKKKKKKKRTLPPPPAIPILSTSSEADRERFSRWYSP